MTRDENSSRPDAELARETRVKLSPAKLERVAAFACFAGSILSLALGFAFTTDGLLSAARYPFLHAVGCTLLIIGIPILILGGHCLDLMEKKNTSGRELHTQRDVAGSLSAELQLCAALPPLFTK